MAKPTRTWFLKIYSATTVILDGANRKVDTLFTKAGILEKIVYPTRGFTTFEYNSHSVADQVPFSQDPSGTELHSATLDLSDGNDFDTQFSDTFIIDEPVTEAWVGNEKKKGVWVNITVDGINNCEYCPAANACAVMGLTSGTHSRPITCSVQNVFIPNGTYTLSADFELPNPSDYQEFVIQLFWTQNILPGPEPTEYKVGGLRIARIVNNDGYGNTTQKIFSYKDGATGEISGNLVSATPVHTYTLPCTAVHDPGFIIGDYVSRTSYSNYPVGMTQGSYLGYKVVSVYDDAAGANGKTVYYYTNPEDFPDYAIDQYPFPPSTNFDHRRGILLKTEKYVRHESGAYNVIHSIENRYEPLEETFYDSFSASTLSNQTFAIKAAPFGINHEGISHAVYLPYSTVSEWVRLTRTIEKDYSQGHVAEKITTYRYNNTGHLQPSSVSTSTSAGDEQWTYLKYPLDYTIPQTTLTTPVQALKNLQQKHQIAATIEKVVTEKTDSTENILSGEVITFDPVTLLPSTVSVFEDNGEPPLTSYAFSTVNSDGTFTPDARYKPRLHISKYDSKGNILEQRRENDVSISYQWGYQLQYPVAEVINAGYNSVFYSGFEEDNVNVSTEAKTGKKSRNTSLILSLPHSGTFSLTYWRKPVSTTSGEWELMETTVTQGVTIGGSGYLIDDVRLYPKAARMKTYTYDPAVGMTSSTDENNVSTFYEYDGFGRLKYIRDDKKNLLKAFKYHLVKE